MRRLRSKSHARESTILTRVDLFSIRISTSSAARSLKSEVSKLIWFDFVSEEMKVGADDKLHRKLNQRERNKTQLRYNSRMEEERCTNSPKLNTRRKYILLIRILDSTVALLCCLQAVYCQPFSSLAKMTDPYLKIFRGMVPNFLGFDLSPLLGFALLTFLIDTLGAVY